MRDRFVVPVGREFLCRREVLGVPGALDGLSHVVSGGEGERRITLGGQHQLLYFCYFAKSVGLFYLGKNKKK